MATSNNEVQSFFVGLRILVNDCLFVIIEELVSLAVSVGVFS